MSNLKHARKQAATMNGSARITRNDVLDLRETIHAAEPDLPVLGARALGLCLCVRLTLTLLRHNTFPELLAEVYGVSQATTSRVIAAGTPLIAYALESGVPTRGGPQPRCPADRG